MSTLMHLTILASVALTLAASASGARTDKNFGDDVAFLQKHRETIVLTDKAGKAKVAVVPSICGRIFTSTAGGDAGASYGYLNYDLIASGTTVPKINGYGGEDRFWMGPEGGQFAIFFKKGDPFTLDAWQTPACIDTDAYKVVSKSEREVVCAHDASLTNCSGNQLDVHIDRTIRIVEGADAAKDLKVEPSGAKIVAFESVNTITNTGNNAWTEETGMLSIWTLGMFKPSDDAVVVVPVKKGSEQALGMIVNDSYFGKVPADRIKITSNAVFFKADGRMRTKIGTSPKRSTPVCGSYDPSHSVLTIVQFTLPAGATRYVNSMWEQQKHPFAGDVINSYNDSGDPATKTPGFYELETSSPAAALKPGEKLTHTSRTIHIEGEKAVLDKIAKTVFGVGVDDIAGAIKP